MEMVHEISAKLLDLSAQAGAFLGVFFMPCVVICAFMLLAFAKNSYKLLKVALPLGGATIGAMCGAALIAPLVEKYAPAVASYINPFYLCALVLAAVLALLCFKYHTFAILIIGAASGFVVVGRVAKDILLAIPFIKTIADDVIRLKSYVVGVIVCIIAMVVFTFLVHRYFKKFYVFVTTVGVAAATLGACGVLFFATTTIAEYAGIVGAVLGALVGAVFCHKQLGDVYLDL